MLVDGRRRPGDPRLLVLEDGQPGRPGRLPGRPGRADRDARQARPTRPTSRRTCSPSRSSSSSAARAALDENIEGRQRRAARAPRRAGRGARASTSPRPSSSSPRAATSSGSTSHDDVDTEALLAEAKEEGVTFVAGPDFMLEGGGSSLRLSFAPVPAERGRRGRPAHRPRARAPAGGGESRQTLAWEPSARARAPRRGRSSCGDRAPRAVGAHPLPEQEGTALIQEGPALIADPAGSEPLGNLGRGGVGAHGDSAHLGRRTAESGERSRRSRGSARAGIAALEHRGEAAALERIHGADGRRRPEARVVVERRPEGALAVPGRGPRAVLDERDAVVLVPVMPVHLPRAEADMRVQDQQ